MPGTICPVDLRDEGAECRSVTLSRWRLMEESVKFDMSWLHGYTSIQVKSGSADVREEVNQKLDGPSVSCFTTCRGPIP